MQKKIKDCEESPVTNFFKSLKDTLISNLTSGLKESLKEKIIRVEKKVFRNITSYCFFVLGIIFVFLGLVFFLNYYLNFNFAGAFLITGVLLLLLAIMFKWLAKNV